jgi:hypothetical protein
MSFTCILVGECDEIFVCFDDDATHLTGNRQCLLDITHRTPIETLMTLALEVGLLVDVYVLKVYYRNGITLIDLYRVFLVLGM